MNCKKINQNKAEEGKLIEREGCERQKQMIEFELSNKQTNKKPL
jgi:hypothetical protein